MVYNDRDCCATVVPKGQKQVRSTAGQQRYRRDTAHRVATATPLSALRTRHCYLRCSVVVADVVADVVEARIGVRLLAGGILEYYCYHDDYGHELHCLLESDHFGVLAGQGSIFIDFQLNSY